MTGVAQSHVAKVSDCSAIIVISSDEEDDKPLSKSAVAKTNTKFTLELDLDETPINTKFTLELDLDETPTNQSPQWPANWPEKEHIEFSNLVKAMYQSRKWLYTVLYY